MDKLKDVFMWIGGAIVTFIVGGFLLLFIAWIVITFNASVNTRYWVDTGDRTYYTNEYKEKDGCLYFHDVAYDKEVKQCGFYRISDKGDK